VIPVTLVDRVEIPAVIPVILVDHVGTPEVILVGLALALIDVEENKAKSPGGILKC
jgi:hypothetical protein